MTEPTSPYSLSYDPCAKRIWQAKSIGASLVDGAAPLYHSFTIGSEWPRAGGLTIPVVVERAMAKKKDVEKPKPAARTEDSGIKIVARNRRARHEFDLLEKVEAGIVLTGTEVKSLRNGKANLEDAYAEVDRGELWLIGCDIPEYIQANRMNHAPKRPRKLLLHRREINKLGMKSAEKGLTLVPLSVYFKKGIAKVELCIARGRKTFDKREALKKQEAKRDMDRALRRR